jgi:hypothetical protein
MRITSPSPFSVRARCKFCSEYPQYFHIAWDRWLLDNFYKDGRLQFQKNMKEFKASFTSFKKRFSHHKMSAHHSQLGTLYYKYLINEDDEDFMIDLITCPCGKMNWMFKVSERDHIKQRRIRYDLPSEFLIR